MLSVNQRNKIEEVGEILMKLAASDDVVDRAILSATGVLRLKEVMSEEAENILKDMIDVPDFIRR